MKTEQQNTLNRLKVFQKLLEMTLDNKPLFNINWLKTHVLRKGDNKSLKIT